jgi:hypothetical protein
VSFEVKQRKTEDVTVLDLCGRIILGEETSRLEETLKALIAGGEKKILLNLAEVTYIDSGGLGDLGAEPNGGLGTGRPDQTTQRFGQGENASSNHEPARTL